jgi:hypothetical protein
MNGEKYQVGMSHSGASCPDERGPYRLNPAAAAAAHRVDRGPPPGALRRRTMVNKQFMKLGPRPVGKLATVIIEDTYYRILRRKNSPSSPQRHQHDHLALRSRGIKPKPRNVKRVLRTNRQAFPETTL